MVKACVLTAILASAALAAGEEALPPQPIDIVAFTPLLAEAAKRPITAAVAVGSGDVVTYKLAPPASSPALRLKPAKGLAATSRKPRKDKKKRPALRTAAQIKRKKRWEDKR